LLDELVKLLFLGFHEFASELGKKEFRGCIPVLGSFRAEFDLLPKKLVLGEFSNLLRNIAPHCISEFSSGERFATIKPHEQIVDLTLVIRDYAHYRKIEVIKNPCDLR